MARNQSYTQCQLKKESRDRSCFMISWIPSDVAKVGNIVRLKEWPSDLEWLEGWEIITIYSKRAGPDIEAAEQDHKNQRKVSDI